jgi:hypothetical protein
MMMEISHACIDHHDDHNSLCSVTSTDMTDLSVNSSQNSGGTAMDGQKFHIPQHRICIFEFPLGDDDTLDAGSTCNSHNSGSERRYCLPDQGHDCRFMWRKSYITSSTSTLSDLTYQNEIHDDNNSQPRQNQNVPCSIPPENSKLQQHPRRRLPRFIPTMIRRSIDRLATRRFVFWRSC